MTDLQRAELSEKIAKLTLLVDTGATSVTIDGVTVQISLPQVRQRLRELCRQRDGLSQARQIVFAAGWADY